MEKKNREEELLNTAAKLFRMKGYDATSISDIAAALGIRKSSLYHYISTKSDLLYRISKDTLEELLQGALEIKKQDLPPQDKLLKLVENHIRLLTRDLDRYATMLRELDSLEEEKRRELVSLRDGYERVLRETLQEGVKEGAFREIDSKIIGFAILGIMNWLIRWYKPGGAYSPSDLAKVYGDFILKALEKKK
ncbi:MAG: TetR family transcriptional regulator [Aquificota bacterium]|nr:MAG: TetR family transcriptional regulator [Aquificota bacterium]